MGVFPRLESSVALIYRRRPYGAIKTLVIKYPSRVNTTNEISISMC